jgi:hypothetical protein
MGWAPTGIGGRRRKRGSQKPRATLRRKTHAPQEALELRVGEGARRLAVVELVVLFPEGRFTAGDGQSTVRSGRGLSRARGAYITTKNVGTHDAPAKVRLSRVRISGCSRRRIRSNPSRVIG